MGVKTTFLNDRLFKKVFMSQSEDFEIEGKEHMICKLKKPLYGLKKGFS